jgi:hypothetical protein
LLRYVDVVMQVCVELLASVHGTTACALGPKSANSAQYAFLSVARFSFPLDPSHRADRYVDSSRDKDFDQITYSDRLSRAHGLADPVSDALSLTDLDPYPHAEPQRLSISFQQPE